MKSLYTDHLHIDYLANYPQHIATLARWHQNQWHDISPQLSIDRRITFMSTHKNNASVPVTLIALDEEQVVGSASLIEDDMEDRPQYTPWLASVFVSPPFRAQGVATSLISGIIKQAEALNLPQIYLFTPDQSEFYANRGWEIIEQRQYHDVTVDIMICRLKTT
jgi:N-acetylglutamate synthase-like GNAT family acetyltransferase